MDTRHVGKAKNRVDGPLKVRGEARYAAEFPVEGMLHGSVVSSDIAKGRIVALNTEKAEAVPGVIAVLTHKNTDKQARFDLSHKDMDSPPGSPFRPLHDENILFSMQPIALVVAESIEAARYAVTLVEVEYEIEPHETSLLENLNRSEEGVGLRAGFEKPESRGDFDEAYAGTSIKFDAEYYHGAEHHNPMEMHVSIVQYEDDGALTIYDKTQGVLNSQHYVCMVFGLKRKKVRVVSPFVGGAFGSGLRPQYQLYLAVLAALKLKRSIKVELTRQQMFSFGHRPETLQQIKIGVSEDSRITAFSHTAFGETSRFEKYLENVVNWAGKLYDFETVQENYRVVPLDRFTPLDMRAPGGATGEFALESALDELSYTLGRDPLQLRLDHYAETDKRDDKPFSSKALRDCYDRGADRFGWTNRSAEPRSRREGDEWIGVGMATGIWDAMQFPTRAEATLTKDLKLEVCTATADIGTGTYTIMTQLAAEALGLPMEDVSARLGDSKMPLAFIEGGSSGAASVGTAVQYVCRKIQKKLLKEAGKEKGSVFSGAKLEDVVFEEGYIRQNENRSAEVSLRELMRDREIESISKKATALPNMLKQRKYALNTHSAVFVEVAVDADFGSVSVRRVVSAVAAGRILNLKTARSQIMGGVVWGISMALHEGTVMDHNIGRFMNHDFSEYHIPVNADIGEIDIIFVEEEDDVASPIGVKGVGEIGMLGVPAAVANAVYHAIGKRVRSLPITLDKVID